MKSLWKLLGAQPEVFSSTFDVHEKITIKIPGGKKVGDYQVTCGNENWTHVQVCEFLQKQITDGKYTYYEMMNILNEIYNYGTKTIKDYDKQSGIILIYWLTLQEDINYPPEKGYLGRRHALSRYVEAIGALMPGVTFSYEDVINRISSTNPRKLPKYDIPDAPSFYNW